MQDLFSVLFRGKSGMCVKNFDKVGEGVVSDLSGNFEYVHGLVAHEHFGLFYACLGEVLNEGAAHVLFEQHAQSAVRVVGLVDNVADGFPL